MSSVQRLDELARLRGERSRTTDGQVPKELETRISVIEASENLRGPARTTIVNTTQLISRALKLAGETIGGIPDVSGVSMPCPRPHKPRS